MIDGALRRFKYAILQRALLRGSALAIVPTLAGLAVLPWVSWGAARLEVATRLQACTSLSVLSQPVVAADPATWFALADAEADALEAKCGLRPEVAVLGRSQEELGVSRSAERGPWGYATSADARALGPAPAPRTVAMALAGRAPDQRIYLVVGLEGGRQAVLSFPAGALGALEAPFGWPRVSASVQVADRALPLAEGELPAWLPSLGLNFRSPVGDAAIVNITTTPFASWSALLSPLLLLAAVVVFSRGDRRLGDAIRERRGAYEARLRFQVPLAPHEGRILTDGAHVLAVDHLPAALAVVASGPTPPSLVAAFEGRGVKERGVSYDVPARGQSGARVDLSWDPSDVPMNGRFPRLITVSRRVQRGRAEARRLCPLAASTKAPSVTERGAVFSIAGRLVEGPGEFPYALFDTHQRRAGVAGALFMATRGAEPLRDDRGLGLAALACTRARAAAFWVAEESEATSDPSRPPEPVASAAALLREGRAAASRGAAHGALPKPGDGRAELDTVADPAPDEEPDVISEAFALRGAIVAVRGAGLEVAKDEGWDILVLEAHTPAPANPEDTSMSSPASPVQMLREVVLPWEDVHGAPSFRMLPPVVGCAILAPGPLTPERRAELRYQIQGRWPEISSGMAPAEQLANAVSGFPGGSAFLAVYWSRAGGRPFERFSMTITASEGPLIAAREALAAYARSCGFAGERLRQFRDAVHEALVNAAEHGAGLDTQAQVAVEAVAHPGEEGEEASITVTLFDPRQGTTGPVATHPYRVKGMGGRGEALIRKNAARAQGSYQRPGSLTVLRFTTAVGDEEEEED